MIASDPAQIELQRKRAEEELRRTGELLRAVADEVSDAIFVKDRHGKYLLFNKAASRLTGMTAADVLGKDDTAIFDPEGARIIMERDRRVMATGVADTKEEILTAAGVTRAYLSTKAPHRDKHGNVVGVIGISRDITERKRAEDSLQGIARRLNEAQRLAHIGHWELDLDTDHLIWSDESYRIFGISPQEQFLTAAKWQDLIHPDDRPRRSKAIAEALIGGPHYNVEYRIVRPNGEVRIIHSQGEVIRDDAGRPRRIFGTVQDVTERKRAEETLGKSERNFAVLVEKSLQGISIFQEKKLVYANPAQCSILGYSLEELQLMSREQLIAIVHPLDRAVAEERARKREAGEYVPPDVELRVVRKDGATRWTQSFNSVIEFNGHPAILSTSIDVTERKRAEESLRESERLLRQVLNALPVGVVVTDLCGNVILSNPASKQIWGGMIIAGDERYAKSKGWWHRTGKRIGPDEWPSRRAFTAGQTAVKELVEIESFDGIRKVIENSAAPIRTDDGTITGAVVINEDVTDVLRLEDQFRQAQKMEAVGHLAAGVAHDFNNLLTIINGYSEIIQTDLPADSPVQKLVREIDQAGQRAASLTRQLLAFSRKQVLEPRVLNVNAIVTDTAKMLRRLIGEDIELKTVLESSLRPVKADPGQIEQVLMNLAVNARDAMPQGGKLTIETANLDLNVSYTQAYPELRSGSYVMLAMSDTGIGMDDTTKAHIFEPFFTTKGPGEGTGLGLATVFGVIKQSNGYITVYSTPGRGTTFRVYLPVVAEFTSPRAHPSLMTATHGKETILLAEDEPAVRALARHALQVQGYTVLEAGQGDKALHIAEEYKGTIDLLVTDVVMPVMSGRELAERLAAIRPGVKVLYLSGYTDDAAIRHGVLKSETALLQKPFTPTSLAAKVREVLDDPGAGASRNVPAKG
jgi:PAS domain S-box-containing protein